MTSPAIVLVRPREEGNIGSVARAMANMGLERLILVEPAAQLGGVARGFGVGGWKILDTAVRLPTFTEAAASFGRLVATASRRQRPLRRHRILTPRQLPALLTADLPGTETALVFGPEDSGLKREELEVCNPVVTIPCAPDQPTLNLAQAVLVLAYEIFVASPIDQDRIDQLSLERQRADVGQALEPAATPEKDTLSTPAEIRALGLQLDALLPALGFDQDPIRAGLLRDLLRLLRRADPSKQEVRILRRLCNRTAGALRLHAARQDPE